MALIVVETEDAAQLFQAIDLESMIFPLVQIFADALAAMSREHPRYLLPKLLDAEIRHCAS